MIKKTSCYYDFFPPPHTHTVPLPAKATPKSLFSKAYITASSAAEFRAEWHDLICEIFRDFHVFVAEIFTLYINLSSDLVLVFYKSVFPCVRKIQYSYGSNNFFLLSLLPCWGENRESGGPDISCGEKPPSYRPNNAVHTTDFQHYPLGTKSKPF